MTGAQAVVDSRKLERQEQGARRKTSLKDYFLAVRREAGFDRYDAIILAIYAAILAFAIHHYLPFADEAQEWLLARDSSLHELLFRRLHYEGHPPLWAMILWIATRLHLPYSGINWMAGVFALPGIYLLLRYSPFPRIFRWLLPFTFFFQYQYAVIARPYVLVPALLFGMCMVFTAERPRPVLFGLLAGLLLNISLHAAIMAGVFCLLYLHRIRLLRARTGEVMALRPVAVGTGIFLLLAAASVVVAFPAPDTVIATRQNETAIRPNPLVLRLIGVEQLPHSSPPLDKPFEPKEISQTDLSAQAAADAYPWLVRQAVITTILGASSATYPLSSSNLLALLFLCAILLWLWARNCPRLFLSYLVPVAITAPILVLPHHTGIFLLALIAAAWIALLEPGSENSMRRRLGWIQPVFCLFAMSLAIMQTSWSWHCIANDVHAASDPGQQTARFLSHQFPDRRVAGFGFETVSVQPYVSRNLFTNWPHSYWVWSSNVYVDRRRTEALLEQPDAVVLDDFSTGNDSVFDQWYSAIPIGEHPYLLMLGYWQQHGYHETHRFCGYRPSRMGVEDTLCEVILEPVKPQETLTTPTANPAR